MQSSELYTPDNVRSCAFQLRFSWTGWPSQGRFPSAPHDRLLQELDQLWEHDGIRRLESRWLPEMVQITVSVKPQVNPVFIAARLKGRLDHAMRKVGSPIQFSRKVSLRSLGSVRRSVIEKYVEQQVSRQRFADATTAAMFAGYALDNGFRLDLPSESRSGRYWYNLHLVLELLGRQPSFDERQIRAVCDGCTRTAQQHGYGISRLSPMPDHLHLALRGNIEHSPQRIALSFMNTIANGAGHKPIWDYGYFVGTFGEYDMGVLQERSRST